MMDRRRALMVKEDNRLPSGYTELQYIDLSSGAYYSMTNDPPFRIDGFATKYRILSRGLKWGPCIISSRNEEALQLISVMFVPRSVSGVYFALGGAVTTSSNYSAFTTVGVDHVVEANADGLGLIVSNGTVIMTATVGTENEFDRLSLPFAPEDNNSEGTKRLYWYKFYLSGACVCDFVPCIRDADDAVGFYERKRKTFLEKNGTGTVTPGPEIGG